MKNAPIQISLADLGRPEQGALGGGLEGAKHNTRELATWTPDYRPADVMVNPVKDTADARAIDATMNDGYVLGALNMHRDSIVGNQFRLNANPNWRILGADEAWADEFQTEVESRFNTIAESTSCWLHAGGTLRFTDMIRLGVAQFFLTQEVLGTGEWKRDAGRPFHTAFQFIDPARLSNPDLQMDSSVLSRGVAKDVWGAPVGYWIRSAHPFDLAANLADSFSWRYVPIRKPWGRRQVIHITDSHRISQTRGISDMVAVMKQIKMTKSFQEVTLQNAVINASYAAAVESELPPDMVQHMMGVGQNPMKFNQVFGQFMSMLQSYLKEAGAVQVDGAKIPHLFPNTKLKMQPMGTPGGVGTQFEQSLLRYTAAGLGLSYEEFSRDYSQANYSSQRASSNNTHRFMQSRKRVCADYLATEIYLLWLEEEIAAGNLPLPPGKTRASFYEPMGKEAYGLCGWIGAGRGQIDELKETQSAMLRIKAGLSTYERECARLGMDFREVFRQRQREESMAEEMGLSFALDASKPGANDVQQTVRGERNDNSTGTNDEDEL